MDAFEAIRTLLAVRSYQDKPVPDAVVRRIVEAGRLTGSGMNGQPWHFIVIRDGATLRRLGRAATRWPSLERAPIPLEMRYLSQRLALLLAASNGASRIAERQDRQHIKAVLDIPAGLDVLAILPFGYPARAVGRGKKQRKPLREVAHLERYGRPFE
ncbi:MAG: nitroreductase [Candidatus Rokuibacteriota bacterium]|nr:MAG: nitroreductase [Candidatus Rokubacteria bacterium]